MERGPLPSQRRQNYPVFPGWWRSPRGCSPSGAAEPVRVGMAWGDDIQGTLGDGRYVNSSTPAAVAALSGLSAITGGWASSVALRSDGTVWAWGAGGLNGSGASRSVPGRVLGLAGTVAVASGYYHTLALRSDGTVWAWGLNESGRLGDGSSTNRTQPVQVLGPGGSGFLSNIVSVAGGAYHSIALRSDGTVWTWGANTYGELGNPWAGSTEQRTPVQVMTGETALSDVMAPGAAPDRGFGPSVAGPSPRVRGLRPGAG